MNPPAVLLQSRVPEITSCHNAVHLTFDPCCSYEPSHLSCVLTYMFQVSAVMSPEYIYLCWFASCADQSVRTQLELLS